MAENNQPHLRDLSDETVLRWWSHPTEGGYGRVVESARHKGIHATLGQARRDVKRRLRAQGRVPRRATSADYARAADRYWQEWYDTEFI